MRIFQVYRMADGEFIFCVSPRPELGTVGSPFWVDVLHMARYVRLRAVQRSRGMKTCWGGFYTAQDRRALIAPLCSMCREDSHMGMPGAVFHANGNSVRGAI